MKQFEHFRPIFEQNMKKMKEKTGRDTKMTLVMSCGPEDAEIFYEQMFACFIMGVYEGAKK